MPTRKGSAEPVSCQLCRSKKLRCSRTQPCSNCESRNVPCRFLVPPSTSQRARVPTTHSEPDILARIERLEALVLPKGDLRKECSDGQVVLTPYSEDGTQCSTHDQRDTDLHVLENVGVREDSLISSLSDDLVFVIRSVESILNPQTHSQYVRSASEGHSSKTVITLPTYAAGVTLFSCFEANVDHMCGILHLPTVRSLMKNLYLRIGQNEIVPPGEVALLLSLFALSSFFHQPPGNAGPAVIRNDSVSLSKYWSRGALDVLEHSRRNGSGTLEDVQALILMSYVTYHFDGFSARYRHLLAMAVSMARDLGLHRLDADNCPLMNRSASLRVLIDKEVKRRAYWHLIASDWTQSTMSGPQEGTYSIHPNHIQVNLPKEYDEVAAILSDKNGSMTVAQPTGLTFLLARIRLSHLSREYTDTLPVETSKLMRVPYEHIIALDRKLRDFFKELPYFFRLDEESRRKSKHLEVVYTKIPMMRYCIQAAAHSKRCRLHQKFLIRASSDPRYSYSKQACLESARVVIRLYEESKVEGNSLALEAAQVAMAVHYTHLALVILVMDLCFNKDEGDHEERGRGVFATLQMLEGARSISPLLNRSLDSVTEVLHKYQVHLSGEDMSGHNAHGNSRDGNTYPTETGGEGSRQNDVRVGDGTLDVDPSIHGFWQNATQLEMGFDSATWDTLFSSLDSRPF